MSHTVYTKPLELIHLDLWGPTLVLSNSGYRYYIHFVDAFSRFSWIFLLINKSKSIKTFVNFKTQVELQFDSKIKSLQTNWGGEFRVFQYYLAENGIVDRVSCPHTQQQNGVVERNDRTIVEHGLTLLHTAHLPLKFWGESFRTIVDLSNRLPTVVLHHKCSLKSCSSPYLTILSSKSLVAPIFLTYVLLTPINFNIGVKNALFLVIV